MKRKAEGEIVRACTFVRNRAISSLTTQRFAQAGERDWGNMEDGETQ